MSKVLIIGPKFFYFNDSIASAFVNLGWDAKVCAYDTPIHPYSYKNKILYKLSRSRDSLQENSRFEFSAYVRLLYDELKPELVFIINGDALLPNVVDYMHASSKIALWLFDSVTKYPKMKQNCNFVDQVFCYEQTDISILKELGVNALFLPQAVDVNLYFPIKNIEKKYDIVFAGDIWQSEKRKRILKKVVDAFSDKKILIWGIYKPWYKNFVSWLTRERKDIYMNSNTDSEMLNKCYNEARVVLNIHNEQQVDGANPKVYEIAATGSCQVCDSNPYINSLFPDNSIALYHSDEECIELIRKILKNPSCVNSNIAYQKTMEMHSFKNRINTVLSVLYAKN